jgi:hypothetical protein
MGPESPDMRSEQEVADQARFDEDVRRKGKVVLEVLAGVGIVAALLMSVLALVLSSDRGANGTTTLAAARSSAPATAATAPAPAPARTMDVKIIPSYKLGPDGKKHDAFLQTEFAVKVGQPLMLRIDNTDESPHSITSPQIGVNIIAQPGVHTYRLLVTAPGRFEWTCMVPCDTEAGGWAMSHVGYMAGYITAS